MSMLWKSKEVSRVDIKPIMKYMKNRINVQNGVNVTDPIIKNFRFTNVKRNMDPGSIYVVAELCAHTIEVGLPTKLVKNPLYSTNIKSNIYRINVRVRI